MPTLQEILDQIKGDPELQAAAVEKLAGLQKQIEHKREQEARTMFEAAQKERQAKLEAEMPRLLKSIGFEVPVNGITITVQADTSGKLLVLSHFGIRKVPGPRVGGGSPRGNGPVTSKLSGVANFILPKGEVATTCAAVCRHLGLQFQHSTAHGTSYVDSPFRVLKKWVRENKNRAQKEIEAILLDGTRVSLWEAFERAAPQPQPATPTSTPAG